MFQKEKSDSNLATTFFLSKELIGKAGKLFCYANKFQ